jgi:hypothetical protein
VFGDGAGGIGALNTTGEVDVCGPAFNAVSHVIDPSKVTDIDMRGMWMTVQWSNRPTQLIDLNGSDVYALPTAGFTSVSRAEHGTVPPSLFLPADVSVVVANPDGVHVVTAAGHTLVERGAMERAFLLADGRFVVQYSLPVGTVGRRIAVLNVDGTTTDIAASGQYVLQDVSTDGSVFYTAVSVRGVTTLTRVRPDRTAEIIGPDRVGLDGVSVGGSLIVGSVEKAGGGRRSIAMDPTGADVSSVPVDQWDLPAVDPSGTEAAWIAGGFLRVLTDVSRPDSGKEFALPSDIGRPTGVDIRGLDAIVNGSLGSVLFDLSTRSQYVIPVKGWATISVSPTDVKGLPPVTSTTAG